MLDDPHRVEPQLVRVLDLGDRLVVGALLGLALAVWMGLGPRLDLRLELVEQIELHVGVPSLSIFVLLKRLWYCRKPMTRAALAASRTIELLDFLAAHPDQQFS